MGSNEKVVEQPIKRKDVLKVASAAGAGVLLMAVGKVEKAVAAGKGKIKGPHWGMLVDLRRCTGCRTCTVACKAENEVPLGVFRTYVHYKEKGSYPNTQRGMAPTFCNHCDNAPCVEVCPVEPKEKSFKRADGVTVTYQAKATYKRPDGPVLWDNERCVGCHMCVENCPYKARFVDPTLQAGANPGNNGIGKCTQCSHRVDKGVEPSCVQSCVGGALMFGDMNDASSAIAQALRVNRTKVWNPGAGTSPQVHYVGLQDKAVLGQEVYEV